MMTHKCTDSNTEQFFGAYGIKTWPISKHKFDKKLKDFAEKSLILLDRKSPIIRILLT